MSIPVTTRLDEAVVAALDRAVEAGLAANRGAVIASAVAEWLQRHGEDAIVASHARRYGAATPAHDQLVEDLAALSIAACLSHMGVDGNRLMVANAPGRRRALITTKLAELDGALMVALGLA